MSIWVSRFGLEPTEALRPTGPAAAEPSTLNSNLLDNNRCRPLLFMTNITRSMPSAPICRPTLPPPMVMNAGALQCALAAPLGALIWSFVGVTIGAADCHTVAVFSTDHQAR